MIFVCGALHLDVIVEAPRLPMLDETLVGRSVRYAMGGKGGNQALAAARMGARVAMAGRVGADGFGVQLLAALNDGGVDTHAIEIGGGASGMSVAIVQDDGEYAAVIVSAENLNIQPHSIEIPADTQILVLQNEVPEAVNEALAAKAKACGVRVILNAAPARALSAALLKNTDLLVVNRGEAGVLLGGPSTPDEAAIRLTELGCSAVIVTLGARGLVMCHGGHTVALPAVPVQIVSAHGAGDAFIGALAAEWGRGSNLIDAARFATAAAALHVASAPDARAAITPDQVRTLAVMA